MVMIVVMTTMPVATGGIHGLLARAVGAGLLHDTVGGVLVVRLSTCVHAQMI